MKMADIRRMDDGEVQKSIEETRDMLRVMRFSSATGKLRETSRYAQSRRDLARLLTEKRNRELSVQ
jgi:large subunit ribosomal protein L29